MRNVVPSPAGRPRISDDYGIKSAEEGGLLPWSWFSDQMAASRNYWICTSRPDGRPHAMPVWGVWVADRLLFSTGRASVKGKNISLDPRVVAHAESGDEVAIVEGIAEPLEDPELIAAGNSAYREKYGLDLVQEDPGAVSYWVRPTAALAWLESDYPSTATRWTFEVDDGN